MVVMCKRYIMKTQIQMKASTQWRGLAFTGIPAQDLQACVLHDVRQVAAAARDILDKKIKAQEI